MRWNSKRRRFLSIEAMRKSLRTKSHCEIARSVRFLSSNIWNHLTLNTTTYFTFEFHYQLIIRYCVQFLIVFAHQCFDTTLIQTFMCHCHCPCPCDHVRSSHSSSAQFSEHKKSQNNYETFIYRPTLLFWLLSWVDVVVHLIKYDKTK